MGVLSPPHLNNYQMQRENVIIMKKEGADIYEAWGSLTELCGVSMVNGKPKKNGGGHIDFNYGYLKGKKFPFSYKGWYLTRVPYRTLAKEQ